MFTIYLFCKQGENMTTPVIARVEDQLAKDITSLSKIEKLDKSAVIRRLLSKAVKEEKINLALRKYSKKEISLAKAARTAGVPLARMMEIAADNKIPINYSKEDLLRDFNSL